MKKSPIDEMWKNELLNGEIEIERFSPESGYFVFKTSCSCMAPNHNLSITIIYDDPDFFEMSFSNELDWSDYCSVVTVSERIFERIFKDFNKYDTNLILESIINLESCFIRAYRRICCALRVLFVGKIQLNGDFAFRSRKQAKTVANGILSGISAIEKKFNLKNEE